MKEHAKGAVEHLPVQHRVQSVKERLRHVVTDVIEPLCRSLPKREYDEAYYAGGIERACELIDELDAALAAGQERPLPVPPLLLVTRQEFINRRPTLDGCGRANAERSAAYDTLIEQNAAAQARIVAPPAEKEPCKVPHVCPECGTAWK